MPDEVAILVSNAMREWETATEHQNLNAYNNTVSLFLLAIKKSPQPIARLHSWLCMVYYEMAICYANASNADRWVTKSLNSALEQANMALRLDSLEFRAQLIKTYISSDKLLYMKGGVSNLLPSNSSGFIDGVFEVMGRAIGTGIAAGRVEATRVKFKTELTALLTMYNKLFSEYYIDATEFLFYSDQLMTIADYCTINHLWGGREIYSSILAVMLDDLKFDNLDGELKAEVSGEIVRIRTLAEGRMLSV